MSMRISVLENVVPKKKQSESQPTKVIETNQQSKPPSMSLYVKQIPRRSKSPFKKYEKAAIEASRSSTPTPINVKTFSNSSTNFSNKNLTNSNKASSSILFSSREPINDPGELKNKNNMKLVNNFEDLVITCVDSSTIAKENNLICYKKKYWLNLTGRGGNISSRNNSELENSPFNNTPIITEKKNVSSESPSLNQKQDLCSRCKKELTDEELQQNKMVHFKQDFTADLIECLRSEDKMLRQKVAEGDSDPSTFRRLERLAEIFIRAKQIEPISSNIINMPLVQADRNETKKSTDKFLIQKKRVFKATQVKSINSLSDLAFTNDLKNHPLIRKNPYLFNKF
jgi:hypothetical protein